MCPLVISSSALGAYFIRMGYFSVEEPFYPVLYPPAPGHGVVREVDAGTGAGSGTGRIEHSA
jgi:hypothetical protein